MLAWTIYISFIAVVVLMLLPKGNPRMARIVAMLAAVGGFLVALTGFLEARAGEIQTVAKIPWIPSLGIEYHLAADGISLTLVLLTGLAAIAGILFSWNIEERAKEFFAFYLALIGGVYGVFMSFDVFLLFVFYEIAIIPKYFIIAIWGSTRREYGAMKLALYSFVGSAMVLVGLIAAYVVAGAKTMSLVELAKFPFPPSFQMWVFPLVFVGFAILAVIGIVYGAMVALVQKDFKFVIGYSSVSHMGFVLLGLMTLNLTGLNGAVLQMFSHGIIASLLFAVVGRMVYDRTHTRELSDLGVMNLNQMIPFAAVTFTIASVASMGLPGFSGFVAELQVLIGAWHLSPTLAVVAGFGILVGVAYTLRALFLAFFHDGPAASPSPAAQAHLQFAPITVPERIGAVLLISASLVIGLYPRLLLDLIGPSFSSPLFDGLRKVCGM